MGEFEYLVLAIAKRLEDDAYGAAICVELTRVTGRRCSLGALYTTIDRLERKGFIKTWMSEPTPTRGGRSKRMVRVTNSGAAAAKTFYQSVRGATLGLRWEH